MRYTEQEQKELNKQLKKWKDKQLRVVKRNNFDYACEKMPDIDRNVWQIIANARSYKDVNWIVWEQAERVIDKYYNMSG